VDVTRAEDGSLLLTYDGRLWSRWLLGLALVMVATAVYDNYRPDADNHIANAAEALRAVLGHDAKPSVDEVVRALLAGGRKIDAVKVLVEQEQLSLSEARARIDALGRK
jgi:ribosomal protein L7/L12